MVVSPVQQGEALCVPLGCTLKKWLEQQIPCYAYFCHNYKGMRKDHVLVSCLEQ